MSGCDLRPKLKESHQIVKQLNISGSYFLTYLSLAISKMFLINSQKFRQVRGCVNLNWNLPVTIPIPKASLKVRVCRAALRNFLMDGTLTFGGSDVRIPYFHWVLDSGSMSEIKRILSDC